MGLMHSVIEQVGDHMLSLVIKDPSLLYTGLNNVITMSADTQAQIGAKPSTSITMTTPCDVILVLL